MEEKSVMEVLQENQEKRRNEIVLTKSSVLDNCLGRCVSVYCENSDVTFRIDGTLKLNEEFECYTVDNADSEIRFGAESLEHINLDNLTLILNCKIQE